MKEYIIEIEYRRHGVSNGIQRIHFYAQTKGEAMIIARQKTRQHRGAVLISLRLQEEKINTAK
jgi:hypothetical protein